MGRIGLFLVDPNQLFREGLKRLLDGASHTIVGEARSLAEAVPLLEREAALDILVLDLEGQPAEDVGAAVQSLRARRPGLKVVILTADRSRNSLMKAIGWSVDSYLFKDMSPDALARSFQLIMLGQQIFPTKLMLSMLGAPAEGPVPSAPAGSPSGLSPREVQILRHLMNGHSNKAIARELCISEATVKVHLKALLRKVRVNNRTQAAVWALNNGFNDQAAAG
jgi:two-component system, NarL family, nitrate/nitrite response regulator NarL